jgi:hypothetical protein
MVCAFPAWAAGQTRPYAVTLEPSSSGQAVCSVQTRRAGKILLVRMVRCSHTLVEVWFGWDGGLNRYITRT